MYQSDNMDEPPMEDSKTSQPTKYDVDIGKDNNQTIPIGSYKFTYIPEEGVGREIKTTINWKEPEMEKKVWVLVNYSYSNSEWKSFDGDEWEVFSGESDEERGLAGYLQIYKNDRIVATIPKTEWKRVVLSKEKPE